MTISWHSVRITKWTRHSEGFPRELLGQPKEARLAYFLGKVVAHPRLKEVHLGSDERHPAAHRGVC